MYFGNKETFGAVVVLNADGTDSVGIQAIGIDDNGHLIVILTNGNVEDLGKVVGADGKDGKDGLNGFDGEDGESFNWRGTYVNLAPYAKNDVVYDEGSAYICTSPIDEGEDFPPTSTDYWELFVAKGADGKSLNWRGEWVSSGVYAVNDIVRFGGSAYICHKIPMLGANPTYTEFWSVLAEKGDKGADGKDGTNGTDGKDGKDGTNGEDGKTPYIKNGYWWIGDTNTNVKAEGTDGKDGENGVDGKDGEKGADGADGISATHSWNGTTLTVTSASGTSSANLKGEKGATGDTGASGKDGTNGVDGVSPTISVSTITGGHRITITDKNGTKNVDVFDGNDGNDGKDGTNGTNGTNGKDGADGRGIKAIARTSGNGAAGTTDTYTITYTDNTTSTFTVVNGTNGKDGTNGEDGKDGERGTGILKVTTAPTSYTTATAGKNPIKRMSISTIKSQAGVDEVLVGDLIAYSYYLYHIYYLDATYAYMDVSQSIRGSTGGAGTSVTVSSVSESTESGGSNVVTFSDGKTLTVKNGKDGVTPHIGDNGNWYIGDTDTGQPSVLVESSKYQYVKKANITDGYFWWVDGGLPYKFVYANYSVLEPITLDAGEYYLSALSLAYCRIIGSDGVVRNLGDVYANASNDGFVLTLTETSTLYLAYYTPTQISNTTPYVVSGDMPLSDGEYFEGEDTLSLEKLFNYDIFDLPYIKNGELVANNRNIASGMQGDYTGVKMGANVQKLMCKARFPSSPYAKVALVTTNYGSSLISDITRGSIHLVFGNNHCSVGVYKTADKLTELLGVSFSIQADAEVSFGFEVNESTNTLTVYLPNGTTRTVTDSSIGSLNGQYAIWEHYINTAESGEFAFCKMTKLWCKDANGEILNDNLNRFDGAIGVAPTGQVYRQFATNSQEFV